MKPFDDDSKIQSTSLGGGGGAALPVDESDVTFDNSAGHDHDGTDSKAVDHVNLANKGTTTHADLDTHVGDATKHRQINDSGSGATDLFSASKILTKFAAAVVMPDYRPPDIKYKDADEITVPAGLYWPAKHRLKGQYQGAGPLDTYWQLASAIDVDIDAAGTLIGGKSTGGTGSWYSVYMTGADSFLVLPFIRVDAISESGGVTTINPAVHNDGTTADNSFVASDDDFNGYRLMYLSFDSNDGTIWEISDTVNGTPDQIKVAEDITSIVSAADWLQMLPPDSNHLYLGTIRIDNSGNLRGFVTLDGTYQFNIVQQVNGNKSTSAANTDIGALVPPNARQAHLNIRVSSGGTAAYYSAAYFYSGASGTNQTQMIIQQRLESVNTANNVVFRQQISMLLSAVASIRNKMVFHNTTVEVAADTGEIHGIGWEE